MDAHISPKDEVRVRLSTEVLKYKIIDNLEWCTVCANKIPHITICTFNGGKPVDSNNITEWKDIEPIIIETKLEKR